MTEHMQKVEGKKLIFLLNTPLIESDVSDVNAKHLSGFYRPPLLKRMETIEQKAARLHQANNGITVCCCSF